ncbi:hypothetical protein P3X46_002334 [Hevea brasiliensis]|uniref:Cytochrome P450 n=2 Tax=Hevea brasiliensis TaxID=3981 RepID=A0ABQ9N5A3_HEVBR|nr:hypothetical protein P3X46_002334 [Hevea brasiliensis]
MYLATVFFYLASILVLYIITKHYLHKIQNLPPCPYPSLPIIGHLYLLKKPLHRTLSKISKRHGPILFFRFGSRPVLVISSPAFAEECLTKNDIIFANRPQLLAGKHLGYNYSALTWAPYGDHWRNLRRISSLQILSPHRLQMLSGSRVEEIKTMLSKLADKPNQTVDMRNLFFELTINSMMRMIAGKRYYGENLSDLEEAKRFQKIIAETVRLGGKMFIRDFLPCMGWIELGAKEEELRELQKGRDGFMQGLIDENRRRRRRKRIGSGCSSSSGEKKTMIEVLLSLQEQEPEYYTDEIIRGLVLILLIGATETSINTLEWALSLLLDHSEVIKKAQIEIDKQVGHGRLLQESDIAQLSCLCNIIKETLRMHPPLPLAVPHESSTECTVGGFHIPRGTMLLVNLWSIQNDPNTWVDPAKFNPERFEGLEEPRDGFKFLPFSSGRRGCPGEGLAMRTVGLTLGSLLQCFEWERISEEMVDMSEEVGATLSKAHSLHAKCRARPAMGSLLSQIRTN